MLNRIIVLLLVKKDSKERGRKRQEQEIKEINKELS